MKNIKLIYYDQGEMAERFKAHAWKACVGLPLPRVRIPPSPPLSLFGRLKLFLSI